MNAAGRRVDAGVTEESEGAGRKKEGDDVSLLLVSDDPAMLAMVQCDIERSLKIPKTLKNATQLNDVWVAINEQTPDAIVLDGTSSGALKAVELLAALRLEPATAALPIVFLAHSSKEAQEAAAWPFVKTMIKPFGPLEFCAALEESLAIAMTFKKPRHSLWR